jgi:hypothetical protein
MPVIRSLTTLPHRRSGLIALGLATGLVVSSLLSAVSATAVKPPGSRAEVILETGDTTGDPDNAITSGWWGHEGGAGPAGTGATYLSMNAANSSGVVNQASIAALLAAMDTDSLNNIFYAIVPRSANGSNEAPMVTVGENAVEAFGWMLDASFGASLSGNTNPNDSVIAVSTLTQVTNWVAAGQPVQGFDNSLVLHDVTSPGSPVSTAPMGTSILNTWPAGTQLSLVAYVAEGRDADLNNYVPIVKRGSDGKAQTAWLNFTTVTSPTSALRTSAGYVVAGAVKPIVTVTHSVTGTSGTVTATIKKPDNTTATDATGSAEFRPVVNNVPGSPTAVAVSNGVATLPITIAQGSSKIYDVKYVPDAAAQPNYLASDTVRHTVTNSAAATPTVTSLSVSGTDTYTLTAGVAPAGAAGTVAFFDGNTSLGQATVSGGTAKLTKALTAGQHALKAVFTPSSAAAFVGSTGNATAWVPEVTTKVKPTKPVVGKNAKVTVTFDTPGATASGQLTVTIKPPKGGKEKTINVAVKNGKATIKLAKLVKGKTKLTIEYSGSGSVLGITTTASVKAAPEKKK